MAAISVAQATVRPGKVQEYLAIVKEAKQLGAKHGLSSRLFVSQLAGPAVGTYSFVEEAADLAALATGLQKFFADAAWPSLQDRLFGTNGVATSVGFSQATEVPL